MDEKEMYREACAFARSYLSERFLPLTYVTAVSGGVAVGVAALGDAPGDSAFILAFLAGLGSLTAWVALHAIFRSTRAYVICLTAAGQLDGGPARPVGFRGPVARLSPSIGGLEHSPGWRKAEEAWGGWVTDAKALLCGVLGFALIFGVAAVVACVRAHGQGVAPWIAALSVPWLPVFYLLAPKVLGHDSSSTEHTVALLAAIQFGWAAWLGTRQGLEAWGLCLWACGLALHVLLTQRAWWEYRVAERLRYAADPGDPPASARWPLNVAVGCVTFVAGLVVGFYVRR
jgi:hypothetical protein